MFMQIFGGLLGGTVLLILVILLIVLFIAGLFMPFAVWRIRKESIEQTRILAEHIRLLTRVLNIGLDHTELLVKTLKKEG